MYFLDWLRGWALIQINGYKLSFKPVQVKYVLSCAEYLENYTQNGHLRTERNVNNLFV